MKGIVRERAILLHAEDVSPFSRLKARLASARQRSGDDRRRACGLDASLDGKCDSTLSAAFSPAQKCEIEIRGREQAILSIRLGGDEQSMNVAEGGTGSATTLASFKREPITRARLVMGTEPPETKRAATRAIAAVLVLTSSSRFDSTGVLSAGHLSTLVGNVRRVTPV
jgi:hypothetical protein